MNAKKSAGRAKAKTTVKERTDAPPAHSNAFPVVGIGASAGGLEAFKQLLEPLPVDTGMAFVLVSHLDPTHKSLLTELLARSTKMPVREARDGLRVEPDHVYVMPANTGMTIAGGGCACAHVKRGVRGVIPWTIFYAPWPKTRATGPSV